MPYFAKISSVYSSIPLFVTHLVWCCTLWGAFSWQAGNFVCNFRKTKEKENKEMIHSALKWGQTWNMSCKKIKRFRRRKWLKSNKKLVFLQQRNNYRSIKLAQEIGLISCSQNTAMRSLWSTWNHLIMNFLFAAIQTISVFWVNKKKKKKRKVNPGHPGKKHKTIPEWKRWLQEYPSDTLYPLASTSPEHKLAASLRALTKRRQKRGEGLPAGHIRNAFCQLKLPWFNSFIFHLFVLGNASFTF